MKYNLKELRESKGYCISDFAKILVINHTIYSRYEKQGEIPSKYIYKLWQKIDGVPLPDDFFYYTSLTMMINMKFHRMTQQEIASMFDISNQSTISSLMKKNIPMYEAKEIFLQFDPLIVPMEGVIGDRIGKDEEIQISPIKELAVSGNLMLLEKRREARKKRKNGKQTTNRLHEKKKEDS